MQFNTKEKDFILSPTPYFAKALKTNKQDASKLPICAYLEP